MSLGESVERPRFRADDYPQLAFSFRRTPLSRMRAPSCAASSFGKKCFLEFRTCSRIYISPRFRAGEEIYLSLTEFPLDGTLAINAGNSSRHKSSRTCGSRPRSQLKHARRFRPLLRKKVDEALNSSSSLRTAASATPCGPCPSMSFTIRARLTALYFLVLAASLYRIFWICDYGFQKSINPQWNDASNAIWTLCGACCSANISQGSPI